MYCYYMKCYAYQGNYQFLLFLLLYIPPFYTFVIHNILLQKCSCCDAGGDGDGVGGNGPTKELRRRGDRTLLRSSHFSPHLPIWYAYILLSPYFPPIRVSLTPRALTTHNIAGVT